VAPANQSNSPSESALWLTKYCGAHRGSRT
jgi:hypothetical protein